MKFQKSAPLRGELSIPGDKSISHRAVMLGALARGTTEITNFLEGADCLSTIRCFRQMGIEISMEGDHVLVNGRGLDGLTPPGQVLDVGNSGTTMRLLSGILAGQTFSSTLDGDTSIRTRPMGRVITPLSRMGADIASVPGNGCAPLQIHGKQLSAICYPSPVASAQVKSAVLFAGLYADGVTSVTEPCLSRNHSEIMLDYFGARVHVQGTTVSIEPRPSLEGQKVEVPGDISSAAYFLAAGLLVPGSELLIKNVGINPTRDGILRVLKQMGADLSLENIRQDRGEPSCDILVKSSSLNAVSIGGSLIPALIDDLPVIAVLAAFAQGTTVIRDAQELKVKESNRIDTVVENLQAMGVSAEAAPDGMIIHGGRPLQGAVIDSHQDHRIAMAFTVAALASEGTTVIRGADCVNISYPGFYRDLKALAR
ncbi:MAG TPA: 3-phosphoshikimate 1-carboxyvinyltransferase [Candidatus Limivivens intestinipullorum]|uniref:3-phosphoshikimate 1-carboxyvinyltransferase n=1 Tax=Candidatus Limivivens intestinipullorum TaxID=2840858 RepID=A0A9D1JKZ4_9FIRM|nr:3-phosphoshikimate 1-carboxyvinyltransferase [Candidatus Limivivens intestinipullorum]